MKLFSSGINQYKGGVAVIIRAQFLQKFGGERKWKVFVQGRLARLELNGAQGSFHIYAVYFDSESAGERDKQIKKLEQVFVHGVHNLIMGDFNFVTSDKDRIAKSTAECSINPADKKNQQLGPMPLGS